MTPFERKFLEFTEPLEGRVPYMYLDVKQLVTCAVGNLIDPLPAALAVKGWKIDGRPATEREIRADWLALKGENDRRIREGAKPLHRMHHKFSAVYTSCRLDNDAIDALVCAKLASNEAYLRKIFPAWDEFPGDARLAIHSIAWACGPGLDVDALDNENGGWPRLSAAVRAQNWTACVAHCKIREDGNPGVVPRNAANRHCFMNAALVKTLGMPTDVVHWPGDAPDWPAKRVEPIPPPFDPEEVTSVEVPHPGPLPKALAAPVSVADSVVGDALRELTRADD